MAFTITLVFILLLLLSAFFSGSETAYFSLTSLEKKQLEDDNTPVSRMILKLLAEQDRLLVTIIVGNNLVNVATATLAAVLTHQFAQQLGWSHALAVFLDIVVVTFVILITSEITPKVIAVRRNMEFARATAFLLTMVQWLMIPLTFPLGWVMHQVVGRGSHSGRINLSEDELKTLAEVGQEESDLEDEEREMISSIFEFGNTNVKEIMIPRMDVAAIEDTADIEEFVQLIRRDGHSRIPVFHENIDHIIGILYAKDLLPYLLENAREFNLASLLREPYFTTETKPIDDLLNEFQSRKIHMAIVVDEYGGTAGIVTLEDIIEEIVGEIQDEFDKESSSFRRLNDGTIICEARISASDLNELMDEDVIPDSDDFESLGGFIFSLAGEVPEIDSQFEFIGYRYTVLSMEGHRIRLIKIEKIVESSGNDDQSGD